MYGHASGSVKNTSNETWSTSPNSTPPNHAGVVLNEKSYEGLSSYMTSRWPKLSTVTSLVFSMEEKIPISLHTVENV